MVDGAFVYSPDGLLDDLDEESFVAAVATRWPDAKIVTPKADSGLSLTARIKDDDSQWEWQIFFLGDGQVAVEGDRDEQLSFAEWAATLVPPGVSGRLLLLNHDASKAAYLAHGMSADEIGNAWNADPPE